MRSIVKVVFVFSIVCLSIEGVIITLALLNSISNPGVKGFSSKDFSQIGILMLIAASVLVLTYFIKKALKMKVS